MSSVFFPARTNHTPLLPKQESRVSIQIQTEPNDKWKLGLSPKEEIVPMSQDPKDPLLELSHELVETTLQNAAKGKKMLSFGALGKDASWFDVSKKGKYIEKKKNQFSTRARRKVLVRLKILF